MIREIAEGEGMDPIDKRIVDALHHSGGCRAGPLATAVGKSLGVVRYRLLTLEVRGIVRVERHRGVTTYFART